MNTTFEFWYDFSSPFTYLAATQVEKVAARTGATLVWRPMLLGAVFKELGVTDVPITKMSPARQRYHSKDLYDWAGYWEVPFRFTPYFPLRTVTALRLALVAEDKHVPLAHALFKAAWVDGQDLGKPDVLASIVSAQGLDAERLLARTQDEAVKTQLKDNTSAALAAGVFGAPSFVVKQAQGDLLFWGQDRLMLVERALQSRPSNA